MQLPNSQVNPETTNLAIHVKDSNDDPVSGATVSIEGTEISSTTGGQGGCNLNNVPIGEQTITVTATGYKNYTDTIEVSNQDNEITIVLEEA